MIWWRSWAIRVRLPKRKQKLSYHLSDQKQNVFFFNRKGMSGMVIKTHSSTLQEGDAGKESKSWCDVWKGFIWSFIKDRFDVNSQGGIVLSKCLLDTLVFMMSHEVLKGVQMHELHDKCNVLLLCISNHMFYLLSYWILSRPLCSRCNFYEFHRRHW